MTNDQMVIAIEEESKKWTDVLNDQQKKIDDIEKSSKQIFSIIKDDSANKKALFDTQSKQIDQIDARLKDIESKNNLASIVITILQTIIIALEFAIIVILILK